MIPLIEIKMLLQTDKGSKNIDFFTIIEPDDNYHPDEDYFVNKISENINDMIDKVKYDVNAGWAMAFYRGNELFTLSFFKGKVGDKWQKQLIYSEDDPTIH
jgi:hypothetical protein